MKRFFQNIKKYNKYAVRSAKAELQSEVAGSYLNWLWWIIEPFFFMLIYTFVFGVVFQNKQEFFACFVFIGLNIWQFFNRMVSGSVKLIVGNRDLVTKVYIPKYILLLSKSYTYLFKLAIALLLTFGLMIYQGVPFTWYIFMIFPVIAVIYLIAFGLGLILMNFGVTLADLPKLVDLGLRLLFYLSGVFYNIETRLASMEKISYLLLRCNPVAFCMHQMRECMIYGNNLTWWGIGVWFVVGVLLCILGVFIIHRNENSYAKVI